MRSTAAARQNDCRHGNPAQSATNDAALRRGHLSPPAPLARPPRQAATPAASPVYRRYILRPKISVCHNHAAADIAADQPDKSVHVSKKARANRDSHAPDADLASR